MLLVMDPRGGQIDLPGEHTHGAGLRPAAIWIDDGPARGSRCSAATPSSIRPPCHHAPDRDPQGQHGRPAVLRRDPEAAGRPAGRGTEAAGRPDPGRITVGRRPARAADPAGRARLDPRPAGDPGGIAEALRHTRRASSPITEHVRARLAPPDLHRLHRATGGFLPIVTLSPEWEQAFAEALVGQGEDRQLAMAPSRLQDFIHGCARPSSAQPCAARPRCC